MPRSDSGSSTGASLTSEDEEVVRTTSRTVSRAVPYDPKKHHPPLEKDVTLSGRKSPSRVDSGSVPLRPTMPTTPGERFRSSVLKVMQMRKASFGVRGEKPAGSEPGIDFRRDSAFTTYGHINEQCEIEVVDYSATKVSFKQLDNEGLVNFLSTQEGKREPWVKVRWINVGGISFDVMSALALKYDLHPLSLEKVMEPRSTARSKVDYYTKHLFVHVLCHSLGEDVASPLQVALTETKAQPRSASPMPMTEKERKRSATAQGDIEAGVSRPKKELTPKEKAAARQKRIKAEDMAIDELKKGERVNVLIRNFYMFMSRDGTLISIHETDRGFGNPIMARLKQKDTILRSTADASLLLQALLDLVVDRAIEIVEAYHEKILKLEREILISPKTRTLHHLHVISGDLTNHRRTLEPLKTLIYGLRRYDLDRCVALAESANAGAEGDAQVVGFLSHKSKVYLADVFDHIEHILSSFEMFESISENLIAYAFNAISYATNEVMRRLTLATIIFLPLTLLTGYFGMNFEPFDGVQKHSDGFFWIIAAPVMVVVVPMFLWGDLVRMWHYIRKRALASRAEKIHDE